MLNFCYCYYDVVYFLILASEEEKLLGSILLPSYKISPCGTDDKIYRKFSFKAEHANMRTYYFAADSQALMVQWMNALSLASILQESNKYTFFCSYYCYLKLRSRQKRLKIINYEGNTNFERKV